MAHSGLGGHHAYQHRSRARRIQPGQLARLVPPTERPEAPARPRARIAWSAHRDGITADPAVTAPIRSPLDTRGNDAAECRRANGTDGWTCQTTHRSEERRVGKE